MGIPKGAYFRTVALRCLSSNPLRTAIMVFMRRPTISIIVLQVALLVCFFTKEATTQGIRPLPGMPPVLDPNDIYAADRPGNLTPTVRNFPNRVYVPNTESNTVTVIDPASYKVIETLRVGRLPQHVTPSYDLTTLWVLNDKGNSLTEINPATGQKGKTVHVEDPYNMYYTPDGKYAIVVAEEMRRLDFRDPQTMQLVRSLAVPCKGVDHLDFSANGRYFIASCEFASALIKVDVATQQLIGGLALPSRGMPQDV